MKGYQPTRGDKAFAENAGDNPMNIAQLLQKVSDNYLSALLSDNFDGRSAGFRAQVHFELERRAAQRASKANLVSAVSALVATLALVFQVVSNAP